MPANKFHHIPVLLKETLESLALKPDATVIDGTLGGAGHAIEIARQIGAEGVLIGLDLDPVALAEAEDRLSQLEHSPRLHLIKSNYKNLDSVLEGLEIDKVDAVLVDIGISSYDLEGSGRGFSFQKDEPLDMRYDPESKPRRAREEPFTAKYILNHFTEQELEEIFRKYSEEPFSKKISRAITQSRREQQFETVPQLFDLIKHALPAKFRFKAADTARRIFQALRIEVNGELDTLNEFLPKAFQALKPGGRLAVISFHSLEDRIVKQYFVDLAKGCICPIDFPQCVCGKKPLVRILSRKPIVAGEAEQAENSRSIPAKLRAIEKL